MSEMTLTDVPEAPLRVLGRYRVLRGMHIQPDRTAPKARTPLPSGGWVSCYPDRTYRAGEVFEVYTEIDKSLADRDQGKYERVVREDYRRDDLSDPGEESAVTKLVNEQTAEIARLKEQLAASQQGTKPVGQGKRPNG